MPLDSKVNNLELEHRTEIATFFNGLAYGIFLNEKRKKKVWSAQNHVLRTQRVKLRFAHSVGKISLCAHNERNHILRTRRKKFSIFTFFTTQMFFHENDSHIYVLVKFSKYDIPFLTLIRADFHH